MELPLLSDHLTGDIKRFLSRSQTHIVNYLQYSRVWPDSNRLTLLMQPLHTRFEQCVTAFTVIPAYCRQVYSAIIDWLSSTDICSSGYITYQHIRR